MTKEEKIREVMELVDKLWDAAATHCTPSFQVKRREDIESKLREILEDTQ